MARMNEYETVDPALQDSVLGLDASDTTQSADGTVKLFTFEGIVGLVPSGLADAPSDNDSYARRNGAWIAIPRFLTYVKTANQEVVSSNAYINDADLVSETLVANAVYRFELMLCYTAGTAEDMRFRIGRTGLTDAEFRYAADLDNSGATTLTFNSNTNCAGNGTTSVRMGNYIGFLITGASTGTLTVQWAQQTAGVTPTTMRAGSMMALRRVA